MSQGTGRWEFWIDVGGTFTDCIGRDPDGKIHTRKVLSSGRQKGHAATCSTRSSAADPRFGSCPDGFFVGYNFHVLDESGRSSAVATVKEFQREGGLFTLDTEVATLAPGSRFELEAGEEAPVFAIRSMMGLAVGDPIGDVGVYLGTTRGTNALLEHKGSRVAFVTTKGFGDALEIGTQARPELFRLNVRRPRSLYHHVVEIDERIDSRGHVLTPLSRDVVADALRLVPADSVDAVAVCLVNAYRNPEHEQLVGEVARELGFRHISLSTDLTPTIQLLPRAGTAVINAYLAPVVSDYIGALRKSLPAAELRLMTSAGGLVSDRHFCGKDSLLSGPAGGVVGFSHAARFEGWDSALGFDMGGTSTDVSRYAGEYEYCYKAEEEGVPLVAPMLAIETVAAGGGSICGFDGLRFTVGPESAGADPGPACYGRGGPLTVTDVNLFSGKVAEEYFPFALDRDAVAKRLEAVQAEVKANTGKDYSLEQIADGFTQVANQKMSTAIKSISTARGYDPTQHALVAFGGAGPQHACAIAENLGVRTVLLPPFGGILSAFGIGMADVVRFAEKTVLDAFQPKTLSLLEPQLAEMEARLRQEMHEEGVAAGSIQPVKRLLDLRYVGEEATITVSGGDYDAFRTRFEELHEQLYGLRHQDRDIEVATVRVELTGARPKPEMERTPAVERCPPPVSQQEVWFHGKRYEAAMYERDQLHAGDRLAGPALVVEGFSTLVIDPGWRVTVTEYGSLSLEAVEQHSLARDLSAQCDPIHLELFHNSFAYIATQMGIALQKASLSVNVKERLDFSCAVLDATGNLIANAPHIPVHLGAMSECIKGLIDNVSDMQPGDVYLSNDPAFGGSHLPDLTVMTPVFIDDEVRFFTASRAHHAEIGGVSPGSFYPFAKNLAEEGVVLQNVRIARGGVFLREDLYRALTSARYPSRSPEENIADIRAAIAANNIGEQELRKMIATYRWEVVGAYMGHIREAAAEKVASALKVYPDGDYHFEDQLDDGSVVKVKLTIAGGKMVIDFTGSAKVNSNSLNANRAVVGSAVMYCVRCLLDEDIPLNSGMLDPIELVLPEGMLNPPNGDDPTHRAAVVAGNVEISQRIVDVLLGALHKAAASQGTMNNVIFGDGTFGYYETIGGGVGGGADYCGASAVHSHMTNTRITDVEILEQRYPVRLRRFAVRRGSGGKGFHPGGDGIVREFEFLTDLEVSLLTQRRKIPPFGLDGGSPGARGRNVLIRKGMADSEELPSLAQIDVHAGDVLKVKTPGGGGWGK